MARNRRARFEYDLSDSVEAGIVLTGTEVKSLRTGKASLEEAYAGVDQDEIWLYGCDIPEYLQANRMNHKAKRPRKLLLHRKEIDKLARLCEAVGVETGIAARLANGLVAAAGNTAGAPLMPDSVAQLTWLGLDDRSIQALKPYVVLLRSPGGTPVVVPVNVNTASKEVLGAVFHLDPATAEHLVQLRQRTPFKTLQDFTTQLPPPAQTPAPVAVANVSVNSSYFMVRGRLRLADRVLVEHSLLWRNPSTGQSSVLQRERVASLEQVGG